jgi:hypothetical protein
MAINIIASFDLLESGDFETLLAAIEKFESSGNAGDGKHLPDLPEIQLAILDCEAGFTRTMEWAKYSSHVHKNTSRTSLLATLKTLSESTTKFI